MHSRNVYNTPPDYTDLAIKYSDFRKICILQLDGKVAINLKNENSLKVLSKTLLFNDFNLHVNFPTNYLIPTVPLRLNYILWIEDILKKCKLETIHGIDIGCGATCIYSLIAAKKNGWKMSAIETQIQSVYFAKENVTKNKLNNLVEICHQDNHEKIFENLFKSNTQKVYDFCLCNPPFYDSQIDNYNLLKDNQQSRKRKVPNNIATGNKDELMFNGGELGFVTKIIEESLIHKNNIRIYSSMLGHKKNVLSVLKELEKNKLQNVIQTEFRQGNTTRWGVAWSFENTINLI